MKRIIVWMAAAAVVVSAVAVTAQQQSRTQRAQTKSQRTEVREERHVGFWDGTVDVCLPYIKGYVPPYYYTVLNYVLPSVDGYRAEQTHDGWLVTFTSTLFSANDYTFTFEIYSSSGGANLTISSVWYNPVQYTGTITQVY